MSASSAHAPIRWVQLTYTSADSVAGGKGGWGVKEVSAGAPDSVTSALVSGAQTRVDEVEETTPFASDHMIRSRVRVLTHRVGDGDATTLWHTVPASRDGTGRPGNVFCHAAQRLAGGAPGFRPIEMWRSPGWLVPFGAAEVNAAQLTDLALGQAVTRKSVIDFLQDPAHDRRYSLEWLVAAFEHTVLSTTGGGPRAKLVLLTESADEAALWLGALSYVLPVPVALAMGFTTFARGRDLVDGMVEGLDVVAVPRADVALLQQSPAIDYLVCDPQWELDEPENGSWTTPWGQRFAADQQWQDAVLDLLALDTPHAVQVLNEADALSLDLTDERLLRLPLGWTLAFALLADPDAESVDRDRLLAKAVAEVPELLDTPRGRRMTGRPEQAAEPAPTEPVVPTSGRTTTSGSTAVSAQTSNPSTGSPSTLVGPRFPLHSTASRDNAMLQRLRLYLQDGWREEPAPAGELSVDVVGRARQQLAAEIRAAVVDAKAVLQAADMRSIRPVAELLSFLYVHQLDPLVEGDEPDITTQLHDALVDALDAASSPAQDTWRSGLARPLRRATPVVREPDAPTPPPAADPLVGRKRTGPGQVRAGARPVPSFITPAEFCVDDSVFVSLEADLRASEPGNPTVGRVAEAVLTLTGGALAARRSLDTVRGPSEVAAAHWLAAHPPWTLEDDGREVLADWARRLRHRSLPPHLRSSMDAWRAAHHVMKQATPAAAFAEPTPTDALVNAEESFDQCTSALAGLLLCAPLDRAADVLALVARRAAQGRRDSVLDVVGPAGSGVLGTAAVRAALHRDADALGGVRAVVDGRPSAGSSRTLAALTAELFDSLTRRPPVPGQSFFGGR